MTPSFRPGDRVRLTGTVTEQQQGLPPQTVADAQVGDRVYDGSDWGTVLGIFEESERGGPRLLVRDDAIGLRLSAPNTFSEIRRPVVDHAETITEALNGRAEPSPTAPPNDERLERETRTVALTWAVNARCGSDEPCLVTMARADAFLAFLRDAR